VTESPHPSRRERLLILLDEQRIPALATAHLPNIRYLTGFTGSRALLFVEPRGATLFTDPRYELQASEQVDCRVKIVRGDLWPELARFFQRSRLEALGLECERVAHADFARLAASLGQGVEIREASGLVEQLRAVKDTLEIAAIRRSVALSDQAYLKTISKLRAGMTEIDVAAEAEYRMRKLGADGPSFETIVASGKRSALPHAQPTAAKIRTNQLLLIDMGASLDGYASDMTRTVHLGRPAGGIRRLYAAVLEAQLAAIDAVRGGVRCSMVDGAARKVLKRHGFERYFQHSTGHGLGLEIHEAPRVGRRINEIIEPNMIITIEPGAYLPGVGGVRIEDTVLVTERGAEVLTSVPRELAVLQV
jgi:Xaa-Pro aminopeptidase